MTDTISRRDNGLKDLATWVLGAGVGDARSVGFRCDGEIATVKRFQNAATISVDDFTITDMKHFCGLSKRSKCAKEPQA